VSWAEGGARRKDPLQVRLSGVDEVRKCFGCRSIRRKQKSDTAHGTQGHRRSRDSTSCDESVEDTGLRAAHTASRREICSVLVARSGM
jgi:hypothetical protein